ncbi:MAG: tetratricopeptide repeat protein [Verrucomicrobiota bacterium]
MIKSRLIKSSLSGLICYAGASVLPAQIDYDREGFWSQPHIIKSFTGSYELETTLTPKMSEEEQVLLKELLELIKISNQQALARLEPELTPESSGAMFFFAANFYAEAGDLPKAKANYRKAIEKFPNFRRAIKNLAIMHVKDAEFKEALELFTKGVSLGLKDTTTMGLLGLCYVNEGKAISAETAYREAIVLDPSVKDWKVGLAKALLLQQKYQESIAVLEEILISEPGADVIWSSQANAYIGLDDPEMAAANLEIVTRLGKGNADTLNLLGNIYMSRNLPSLALTYFQRAIDKDPNQPISTHIETAEILATRGSFDEAAAMAKKVRSSYKNISRDDETKILRLESQIALASTNPESAIPILTKLVDNDPLDGDALMMLADYNSGLGDIDGYTRADIYFERATKIPEFQVRALIAWASSYVSREKFGEAIPLLERANTLEPKEHIGRYLDQVRKVNLAKLGL